MSLVAELRRRNVFRVAAAYLVVGWLLTEVLTTILPTLGAPEWTARAVILIFAFGFIPAVVFSWFYELTPEGLKREDELLGEDRAATQRSRKLEYVTVGSVVVLVVFIGLFSAQQAGEAPDPDTTAVSAVSNASVAVLPFVNMSNDTDNEYFSDGLTETLLHMLAQVPSLKVAARTSSFAFKGQNKSIPEIARALGVAHVLEGSVQRAGDRVRVTAQLIRASDGFHVWSDVYDRTLDDIFGIQDEIAQKVGYALSSSLLGSGFESRGGVQTSNPDAYDLYLQARKERATFSYGGLKAAEDLLKGALLIDPGFIEAKTELATSYISQWETGLISADEAFAQVSALTTQVLEVQPDDVVARAAKGYVDAMARARQGDFSTIPAAIEKLESLAAEAPNEFQLRTLLVRAYLNTQQPEKALPVLEEALVLDPFNPQIHYELGTLYLRLDRPDEARAALEKSLEIEPAQPNAYSNLADISQREGDGVGYVKSLLRSIEVDPRDHELPGMLAQFLYQLELIEEGDDFRDRVMTIAPTSEIAYRLELLRAMHTNETSAAQASARRAILDGVDDRHFAYNGAIRFLLRSAIKNGTIDTELAWLAEQEPGIFDLDAEAVRGKYRQAQYIATDAWYVSLPREELLRRLDILLAAGREMGFDLADDPNVHLEILAMRGDIQEAIRVALDEVFSQSVAMNLGWRETFAQAQFAEVVDDTRVRAAMQRWETEERALRSNVAAYLEDLQAAG